MSIRIMTPEQRIVPRKTEAQETVKPCKIRFGLSEGLTKATVGLCDGPEFKRIVEFVEACDLESLTPQVLQSKLLWCEVIRPTLACVPRPQRGSLSYSPFVRDRDVTAANSQGGSGGAPGVGFLEVAGLTVINA